MVGRHPFPRFEGHRTPGGVVWEGPEGSGAVHGHTVDPHKPFSADAHAPDHDCRRPRQDLSVVSWVLVVGHDRWGSVGDIGPQEGKGIHRRRPSGRLVVGVE
jgi:hypothetical protein